MDETTRVADARAGTPLWSALLESLRGRIPRRYLDELEQSIAFVELCAGSLRIAVPPDPLTSWLREGYLALLASTVSALTDGSYELSAVPVPPPEARGPLDLDPAHCLGRFVVSPSNQLASAAAEVVARSPGERYSPLFVHGGPASGKTHLLRGIAQAVAAGMKPDRVLCLSAERLSLELIAAIWADQLARFRARYRQCGALLIDDAGTVAGREATQEELVHTLDTLEKSRVQVVATGAHPPEEIPGLSGPLARRLAAGLVVKLSPPEWETRVAILMDRVRAWNVPLTPEVASFLAARIGTDQTRLDTVLTRVMIHPGCADGLTDVELVREALRDGHPRLPHVPPEAVISLVARHFGLRTRQLHSRSRSPRIATPRQIAIYLLRRHCGLSYPEIGRRFGRHHTTAIHACRQIARRLETDERLRSETRHLEREILRRIDAGE
jgi:chromosomal replication initiator protein